MTFRSQIEPSIKSYECFMFLRNFRLEITLDWWILERPQSCFFKNRERVKTHYITKKTKLKNCLVILMLGCFSGWFWIMLYFLIFHPPSLWLFCKISIFYVLFLCLLAAFICGHLLSQSDIWNIMYIYIIYIHRLEQMNDLCHFLFGELSSLNSLFQMILAVCVKGVGELGSQRGEKPHTTYCPVILSVVQTTFQNF